MALFDSTLSRALAALGLALLGACRVAPPAARFEGPAGLVRADSTQEAERVARRMAELEPGLEALLPDLTEREIEVWIQPEPHLYPFATSAYEEADGFWAEGPGRIHLRRDAESLERTLAHEMVHARLGERWDRLPGTIEEGLCDWISARLCPDDAGYMRAGRLSAASFGLGGMELEISLVVPRSAERPGVELGCSSRVLLTGEMASPVDPAQVFSVRAGLSTTRMETGHKKALYGLAFLVVDRIAEREGVEALHAMCVRAEREGLDEVPAEWLLSAAGLEGSGLATWRAALRERFGEAELAELLEMYPALLFQALDRSLGATRRLAGEDPATTPISVRVGLRGASERLELALPPL